MRQAVGKTLRVGPGDEVMVRASLPSNTRLCRLYVFGRALDEDDFSPYVANIGNLPEGDRPMMYSPLSLRLTDRQSQHEISFVAEIDGLISVMQEMDTAGEPKAAVKLKRKINPLLGWKQKLSRRFDGVLSWKNQF